VHPRPPVALSISGTIGAMRLLARAVLLLSLASFAIHCGGSSDDPVLLPIDAGSGSDAGANGAMGSTSGGSSGTSGTSGTSGGGAADGGATGEADASLSDAGGSCKATGASCSGGGRTCLCCGSNASGDVCLCTVACKNDGECPYSTHSLCNKPKGQQMGICTPRDFACGW